MKLQSSSFLELIFVGFYPPNTKLYAAKYNLAWNLNGL
jgi:hypothetical protein